MLINSNKAIKDNKLINCYKSYGKKIIPAFNNSYIVFL